jgi:hypothetical protein
MSTWLLGIWYAKNKQTDPVRIDTDLLSGIGELVGIDRIVVGRFEHKRAHCIVGQAEAKKLLPHQLGSPEILVIGSQQLKSGGQRDSNRFISNKRKVSLSVFLRAIL